MLQTGRFIVNFQKNRGWAIVQAWAVYSSNLQQFTEYTYMAVVVVSGTWVANMVPPRICTLMMSIGVSSVTH